MWTDSMNKQREKDARMSKERKDSIQSMNISISISITNNNNIIYTARTHYTHYKGVLTMWVGWGYGWCGEQCVACSSLGG
jgi:hypothetical protein